MMIQKVMDTAMKIVIKVPDIIATVKKFEEAPLVAMRDLVAQVKQEFAFTLERLMNAEIELFLGKDAEAKNKRNGYGMRDYDIKGIGRIQVRVPRDREGRYQSQIIPARRHYDSALEQDIALLHLAGLSTRMMAQLSRTILGMPISAKEVTNCLHKMVPAAKAFLERPLSGKRYKYLYLDGTYFRLHRSTVAMEPTLVVIGVDETDHKSILAAMSGDKESRSSWEVVISSLKERGLDSRAVQLGIMDGLSGLTSAFTQAFPNALVARCWNHKGNNVFARVPKRYQAAFKAQWQAMEYADGEQSARSAFVALKNQWGAVCSEAVKCIEKDLDELLVHYAFPKEHWDALRTTNPIERVNKEFKRRSKSMETMGENGLTALLAFTALRLEFGWATTAITSTKLRNLKYLKGSTYEQPIDAIVQQLLN